MLMNLTESSFFSAAGRAAFSALALGLLALTGCGSTVESRISKYPEVYASLPPAQQQLVRSGQVREGMDRGAVYLAWGAAHEVLMGQKDGRDLEVWQYYTQRSTVVDYAPSPLWYYPGGYYHNPGPLILTEDVPGRRAVFANGRLREWVSPRYRY